MKDLIKYCKYLYNSLFTPIYVYDNNKLVNCFPNQQTDTYPPDCYLSDLLKANKKVAYTITTFYSYYGYIKIENSNSFIVIGPVNDFPYTTESLRAIYKEFSIIQSNIEAFSEFFCNIPTQNLDTFINTILFINYSLNNTELTRKDITDSDGNLLDTSIYKKYSEETYVAKEEGTLFNNYNIENELIRYVETGNIIGLKRFYNKAKDAKVGIMAPNDLRQFKNMSIVLVTLSSRAAIRGGLSPSIAYPLSEIYLQQIERLTDIGDIKSLISQIQLDYANRVATTITPVSSDNIIFEIIQYVQENTNKNLTVTDIASHMNFSRSYISRKFKKELKLELSTFIRRCKLEEAKNLLLFSTKSISEISNYLSFSSQSHFQKAFKNEYGTTPHAFRKSESQNN